MEKTDTRPPFAASGGVIPPEFRKIKTPCYVLDETALIKNAELMGKIAEKTGCKMLLAQKAFSNYDCYHLLALIWLEQKQVDCTKQGLAPRRCQEKRYMSFVLDTVRMNLKSCFALQII